MPHEHWAEHVRCGKLSRREKEKAEWKTGDQIEILTFKVILDTILKPSISHTKGPKSICRKLTLEFMPQMWIYAESPSIKYWQK